MLTQNDASSRRVTVPVEPLERRQLFSTYTVNGAGGGNYADLNVAIDDVPAGSTLLVYPGPTRPTRRPPTPTGRSSG